mmetsp:Transcript_7759/g.17518  ORF Transcript_7759/g.17518 Transcript_7759/m.17518 type:complete len:431 (-) Transcript_7759:52-1344(-)
MSSNDLIIDKGFTVLNDFKPGADNGDKSDPIPRSPFASYANALSIQSDTHKASFLNDCSLVFTARTKEDSDSYSTGSTYFLPCHMKPRCALEALAQTIFRAHVDSLGGLKGAEKDGEKKLLYDPERSGAEWWTLVLDTPSGGAPSKCHEKDDNDDDDDDEEEDDEVGMHFDADYGLEEQLPNYTLHPRVATITYFSDTGVPTLILDKRSPPPPDEEKKSLNGSINKAWLSHPCFGKHVAFDGRYLHGAPGEYFPSVSKKSIDTSEPKAKRLKVEVLNPPSATRITFMVNIWLNHCPLESGPLDDDVLEKLTTPWEDAQEEGNAKGNLKVGDPFVPPFQWNVDDIDAPDKTDKTASLARASNENGGPAGVEDTVICNRHVDISFGASIEDFHRVSKLAAEDGSMPIEMEDGVFTLKVGKEASSDEEDEEDA